MYARYSFFASSRFVAPFCALRALASSINLFTLRLPFVNFRMMVFLLTWLRPNWPRRALSWDFNAAFLSFLIFWAIFTALFFRASIVMRFASKFPMSSSRYWFVIPNSLIKLMKPFLSLILTCSRRLLDICLARLRFIALFFVSSALSAFVRPGNSFMNARYSCFASWRLVAPFCAFRFLASWINLFTLRLPFLNFRMMEFWLIWLRPSSPRRVSSFTRRASMFAEPLDSWSLRASVLIELISTFSFLKRRKNAFLLDWLIWRGVKNERRFCAVAFFFSSILFLTRSSAIFRIVFTFAVSATVLMRASLSVAFNLL